MFRCLCVPLPIAPRAQPGNDGQGGEGKRQGKGWAHGSNREVNKNRGTGVSSCAIVWDWIAKSGNCNMNKSSAISSGIIRRVRIDTDVVLIDTGYYNI